MSTELTTFGQMASNLEQQEVAIAAQEPTTPTTQEPAQVVENNQPVIEATVTETQVQESSKTEENASTFNFSLGEESTEATPQTAAEPTKQPAFNFDEELKKVDRKELLKKAGVNDFAIELDEYLAKGGKAQDYLNARAIDYNQISDEDLIKDEYRKQYPNFSKEEINRLFNRKYGVNELMTDEERDDKLLELKADGYSKRQAKIAEQQTFKIPDTPILQKDEAYEQWKQSQESQPELMAQLRNYYETHEATKALNESKRVAINLGKDVPPFNFNIDRPEVLTQMFTDNGAIWQKVTSTATGEPDVQKQQLIGLFSLNPQQFIQDIFKYGQSQGLRNIVAEGQNAIKPQAKVAVMNNDGTQSVSIGKFGSGNRQ